MIQWLEIPDYEGLYEINSNGQVRRGNKILKIRKHLNGYLYVCLCKNGKPKTHRIHRLLATVFIDNPENKREVNHIDGNRQNNDLKNLEWATISENRKHAVYVTKTLKPSMPMKGKFGDKHNRSLPFSIQFLDGKIKKYGSGLEFTRCTGFDHTGISYARRKNKGTYKFRRGDMKGMTVHFNLNSH